MTNKKLTYAQALETVLAKCDNLPEDVKEKIVALHNKYTAKADGEKKPTKTQKENAELKTVIFQYMKENVFYSATQLYKEVKDERLTSVQKVTALLGQLATEKLIERVVEKRKTFFVKH